MDVATQTGPPVIPPPGVTTTAPVVAPVTPVIAPPAMPPAAPLPGADVPNPESATAEFFKSINWLEAGIMIVASAALYYTIYFYRFKLKEDKIANNDMQKQIDEVKGNVQNSMKGKYKAF